MTALEDAIWLIKSYDGPKVRIMEVCGTHTHEIFRQGIRSLLSDNVELISGPGCPVCVTPSSFIDEAVMLAVRYGVTVCTFGDLVRVPGSDGSLADARAMGAKLKTVYSPQDAFEYAKSHRDEKVVFLSVGFETTTPSCCIALEQALDAALDNFSLLTANKTMPEAYMAMKDSTDVFLYPGHVHAISGTAICERLAELGTSGVVAGFTAKELITAFAVILNKAKDGKPFFVNCYPRVVKAQGNPEAVNIIHKYMTQCDSVWRGIGSMKNSGLELKDEYRDFDARHIYDLSEVVGRENPACRCGEVLQGKRKPVGCPLFGRACSPDHPIGACMVSSEGACAAYYAYGENLSL